MKQTRPTNFVGHIKTYKSHKTRKKFLIVFFSFIGSLIILLAVVFVKYWPIARNLYSESKTIKSNLTLIENNLKKEDFSQAQELLGSTVNLIDEAEMNLIKISFLKYIPICSSQYLAIEKILSTGNNLATGGRDLLTYILDIIQPFKKGSKVSFSDISSEQKAYILGKIYQSKDLLQATKKKAEDADRTMAGLSTTGLVKPVAEAVSSLKKYSHLFYQGLDQGISLVQMIPPLVGYPVQKNYLFLLENNAELRPAGGFIGTYGIIRVKNAEIVSFSTDNVYNLDSQAPDLSVTPPAPLQKYNKVYQWYLRDSNWSPDFPTAAQQALWFYQKEGGSEKNLAGVIAITPTFIESLIGLAGDITVDGVKFTKSNFVDTLQFQVEKGFYQKGLEMSQRKEIIGDMSAVLMERIFSMPQEKWINLWHIFTDNISNKQILIYQKDNDLEEFILAKNWGGAVVAADGDYFTFIDANLASLKTDPVVKRTINYYLKKENNRLVANLQVVYKHEGNFDWKTTRYRTYFRLYVPKGSKLIDLVGTNEEKTTGEELDKTFFGSFITVEPQETVKITFVYELPVSIFNQADNKQYDLLVQKQAGTDNYTMNIYLDFGRKIKDFTPLDRGKKESNNKLSFRTSLNQDLGFSVTLK